MLFAEENSPWIEHAKKTVQTIESIAYGDPNQDTHITKLEDVPLHPSPKPEQPGELHINQSEKLPQANLLIFIEHIPDIELPESKAIHLFIGVENKEIAKKVPYIKNVSPDIADPQYIVDGWVSSIRNGYCYYGYRKGSPPMHRPPEPYPIPEPSPAKDGKHISQSAKPTGRQGKIIAKGMARGHKKFYENTARVLELKENDRFLDIGFGSGMFIKKHASLVSKISGIDYSPEMVEMAMDINRKLVDSGKAEFKLGDVASMPWKDNTFTAAGGIETFFFWPEPTKALKEIHRVLAPGGRLVIEMAFNKDDGQDHSKDVKKHGMKLYSSEEVKKLFKDAGFVNIKIEYYKCLWFPFKGYVVTKGMIVKGVKR